MSKKVLVVATVGRFFDFERNDINILLEMGYEVHCASNFLEDKEDKFSMRYIKCKQINFKRNPLDANNYFAFKKLVKLLSQEKYDFVHCHTPVAGVLTRFAARKYKKNKVTVIYTAHGFHFFTGAPLKNWLFFFPIEWICSWWTDVLITINREDYHKSQRLLHANKNVYIPGVGLNIQKIERIACDRVSKRLSLGIDEDDIMLVSSGEINKNKNHIIVIRAIANINNKKIKYVICGSGEEENRLKEEIKNLNLDKRVKILGWRNDVIEILKASDIFVFPSKREGLGMAALEAMCVGLPIIAPRIHGIKDYLIDGKTGYSFSLDNIHSLESALESMIENRDIRTKIGIYNKSYVKKFDISNTESIMKKVYKNYAN